MLMLMPSPIGQQPASQPPRLSFNGDLNDNNSDSLASNNPFRNMRTASPSFPTTPTSPFADPMPSSRPLSRNPFLDQPLAPRPVDNLAVASPDKTQSLTAEDIFVRCHLSPSLYDVVACAELLLSSGRLESTKNQPVLTKVFVSI
jgi:hypothetical protein